MATKPGFSKIFGMFAPKQTGVKSDKTLDMQAAYDSWNMEGSYDDVSGREFAERNEQFRIYGTGGVAVGDRHPVAEAIDHLTHARDVARLSAKVSGPRL